MATETAGAGGRADDWRILRTLAIYRILLIALLAVTYGLGYGTYLFDAAKASTMVRIIAAYALPAALLLAGTVGRRRWLTLQAHAAFLIDSTAVIALMYAANGVSSGIGVLLITPAVGSSLILPLRLGLMHAAIGTIAVLSAELLRQSGGAYDAGAITTAGLLGLMLFVTALGAGVVAQRARSSEALAVRVGIDLANLSQLNERIVESMDTAVLVLGEDRRLRLMNAAARSLLIAGTAGEGAAIAELLPALNAALLAWEANPYPISEPLYLHAEGAEVLPRFNRLGTTRSGPVLVLLDDATRLREQAQQLKLAALGRLSAGISHEIRNPLSAIRHAGQLLAESPQMADEDRRLLDMIQRHSLRIDRIVGDVLHLSRRDAGAPQSILMKAFLDHAIAVYHEGCPNQERPIVVEPVPGTLRVRFDPNHLQQILHNLWQNSFDHGAGSGTVVRVQLSAGWLGPERRPHLDIGDDGSGIPTTQQHRLFEPFFTTSHQGTGLGLYLSRELCEYNQARLMYLPGGNGTRFRIMFAAG